MYNPWIRKGLKMPKSSSRSNLPKKNHGTAQRDVHGRSIDGPRMFHFKFPFLSPRLPVTITFFSFHLENLTLNGSASQAEGFFAEVIFSLLQLVEPAVGPHSGPFSGQLSFNSLVGVSAGNNNLANGSQCFEFNGSVFAWCTPNTSGVLQQNAPRSVSLGPYQLATVTVTDGIASLNDFQLNFTLNDGIGDFCEFATISSGAPGQFTPTNLSSTPVKGNWALKNTWTTPIIWWPLVGSDYPSLQNPPGGNPTCGEFPM